MQVCYSKIDIRPKNANLGSPQALQLLKVINDELTLNEGVLRMLENASIANRKVSIISVAGAMRQGKSFLLNFFLHFLNEMMKGKNANNWLDNKDTLFPGFSWETRSEKVTEGILIWPEVFLTTINNEGIAVILMDTQGTYDNSLNMTQCTSFFALSVLLSSLQIYNIRNNLNLNYLQDLQLFTGYAGFYQQGDERNETPFQNLLILVRDWCYPQDHEFGATGGRKLLQTVFMKHASSKQSELMNVQSTIRENYENVDCFLLPYPGENVTTSRTFQGSFKDISSNFIKHVKELVPMLLTPQKLVLKKINGEYVTAKGLPTFIEANVKMFNSKTQVNVSTIFSANLEAYYNMLMKESIQRFHEAMRHCESGSKARDIMFRISVEFRSKKTMSSPEIHLLKSKLLIMELMEIYNTTYKDRIESSCHIL